MPCARVTTPLAVSNSAASTPAHPTCSKNYGERTWRLLNERDAAAASTNNTNMSVVDRPADTDPPPQPDTFVDADFYIKLKETLEVIFVSGWVEFMQQY